MSRKTISGKKKKSARQRTNTKKNPIISSNSWVDNIKLVPLDEDEHAGQDEDYKSKEGGSESSNSEKEDVEKMTTSNIEVIDASISIASWNVLAEAYCSRRSHRNLPSSYSCHVFNQTKRRLMICQILMHVLSTVVDVICLQEVDLNDIGRALRSVGYTGMETPRSKGNCGGRTDACAVYVKSSVWKMLQHEIVHLDDLATLSTSSNGMTNIPKNELIDRNIFTSHFQGIQQTFLRRNVAMLIRLEHVATGQTVVIANAHLFWNPGFEYVKLCQAHYILKRAKTFCNEDEPFIFCGDLNSRPHGVTHSYLSKGYINAKRVAPWYALNYENDYDEDSIPIDENEGTFPTLELEKNDEADEIQKHETELALDDTGIERSGDDDKGLKNDGTDLNNCMNGLDLSDVRNQAQSSGHANHPRVRYLLDSTLNKFCRWLRILGQDAALETEEEEILRTSQGKMILFERCRSERRTLVTTSTRLIHRRDCPASVYCISPQFLPNLEVALVHMLLTHGVVLEPKTFLTRCVICNGSIVEVDGLLEKKRILSEYEAPEALLDDDMEVYECDGCKQGYWWCDRPTSSASRVKTQANQLIELCLKAGIPIDRQNGEHDMFWHIDHEKLKKKGWDHSIKGSALLEQKLDAIDWLKEEHLQSPLKLKSVYARRDDRGKLRGELLPFTNVTHDFVSTLDYIFFDSHLEAVEKLYVPKAFTELNRSKIENGHLLPSDVWPSDHLAVGARFLFRNKNKQTFLKEGNKGGTDSAAKEKLAEAEGKSDRMQFCLAAGSGVMPNLMPVPPQHNPRCDCGCVPAVPSLFEMAELRRQAKLQQSKN